MLIISSSGLFIFLVSCFLIRVIYNMWTQFFWATTLLVVAALCTRAQKVKFVVCSSKRLTPETAGIQMDTVLFENNVADGPAAFNTTGPHVNSLWILLLSVLPAIDSTGLAGTVQGTSCVQQRRRAVYW